MPTVSDVLAAIDRLAPLALAESWDNVGLIFGDGTWPAQRVLVSLDVGEAVIEEAERLAADCLVVHHPLLFKPVSRLTDETRTGRLALRLLAGKRAVIAAHTNLDSAAGGLCDIVGGMAGLEDMTPLQPAILQHHHKIVVFVPEAALEAVRSAAFAAGAGGIGRYSQCSFTVAGTGTFLPGEGARPAVGQPGQRSTVPEVRLEMICPDGRLAAALAAIGRAHPYAEPAIDVFPLHPAPSGMGIGRVGRLTESSTAAALADKVKRALGLAAITLAGDPRVRVERAAVVTGAGSDCIETVIQSGAQAFITGELRLHETQHLAAAGVAVILGGHWATERVPLNLWAPRLAAEVQGAQVVLSQAEVDPHRSI
jgi:dinuclear metal center YbgI/SA1388 family protein